MRRTRPLTRAAIVVAALAGQIMLPGASARATFPGANGRIAFDDFVTGQTYAINPDGTGLVQLTHVGDGQFTGDPDWSPDGKHIAFESNASGSVRMRIMNADGSHSHLVADDRSRASNFLPPTLRTAGGLCTRDASRTRAPFTQSEWTEPIAGP